VRIHILFVAVAIVLAGCGEKKNKTTVSEPPVVEPDRPAEKPPEPQPAPEPEVAPEDQPISTDAPKDVAAAPADATKTKSGLAWKQTRKGTGTKHAGKDDVVWVHYNSWAPDGKLKQSTYKKGQPRVLKMAKAVKGWREAISLMVPGERRRYWLPKKLAFSRSRARGKKAGPRVIEFDLVKVLSAPAAPPDLKKPPKGAKKTGSGLIYTQLSPGIGKDNPGPTTQVTVRYSGWTKDGRCFDFTPEDETQTFGLARVIPGWTEGIQLMVKGQKMRFWIPKKIAYKGEGGKPAGQLVFDVELLEFDKP